MHSAVQPLDLLTLPEFMPLFGSFFGGSAIVVSVIGIALWLVALTVAWRRMRTPLSVRRRAALGLSAALLLTALVGAFLPPQRLPDALATRSAALRRLTTTLGAPVSEFKEMARAHGIVLSFLSELPSAFVNEPREYSKAQVERTTRAYTRDGASATGTTRRGGVSLVIYLVESMMDPRDLGVRFTSDPMPNFRAATASHPHGRAIVPHAFGGSANTEFELLTGMTNSFLPNGSIPYRQYVGRRLPALPHLLHDLGYTTTAIQADKRYYYDRERVYPLLGFDRSLWLHDEPVRDLAPRGGWPSDESIVDAVIQASQQSHPFFVFAFPSSSHSPYDFGTFTRSDLTVLDAPSRAGAAELQEYANAVRLSDRAVGRLIEHFRARSDSTIVVVMGDHLPPLSTEALRVFSRRLAGLSAPGRALAERAVPLVVWANFTLPREEITLSTNMLPGYLLERMGVPPSTLLAITDSIRRTLPVVGMVVESADGRLWSRDSVPATLSGPLDDYRRVQYDLLLGEGFALSRQR
jgi:phosphoglycerol transferase MdoB-like AlkP superfamily enzyme